MTVVWLSAIVSTAQALGELSPGHVEGGELVLRVCFGSDNLPSRKHSELDLVFRAGVAGMIVTSDLDRQLLNSMQEMFHFFGPLGDIISESI
jgi:hypothetical protein